MSDLNYDLWLTRCALTLLCRLDAQTGIMLPKIVIHMVLCSYIVHHVCHFRYLWNLDTLFIIIINIKESNSYHIASKTLAPLIFGTTLPNLICNL